MNDTCSICGARHGMWHHQNCKYRIGAPFDEFLCQYIGKSEHDEKYKKYVQLSQLNHNP
jgi:hypothetical protein